MADTPILSVTLLGAGREVGRSCCVLQYRGKTIVCGMFEQFIDQCTFTDDEFKMPVSILRTVAWRRCRSSTSWTGAQSTLYLLPSKRVVPLA
jgi:hypothetical protein